MKRTILTLLLTIFPLIMFSQERTESVLTDQQIIDLIEQHRPLKSGAVPQGIAERLGATHMDGQYYFTDEPYIIEGARKLDSLGYGILKLWFAKADGNAGGYRYNSDWQLTKIMSLKDLAMHPYYRTVFGMPFSVFALNINEGYGGASVADQSSLLERTENEFYVLTMYLLDEYRDRDVTFILEMWEGDWTMRGGTQPDAMWKQNGIPPDAGVRVRNMIDWVRARQNGVDRARRDAGETRCKVYHAVEVNKVYDGLEGIPSITTSVLPEVKIDMVSWSAYDGRSADGIRMYRGIDHIRSYLNPSDYMKGRKIVFIGEIGLPENINNETRESVRIFWDLMMGVYLAQDIPYIIHWELFCNEPKVGPRSQDRNKTGDELRGFWLIRPDGSSSWAQEYMEEITGLSRDKNN